MTVRLELRPDVEANMAAQARARGIPLDAYLQSVVEDLAQTETALKPRIGQAPRILRLHWTP